MVRDFFLNTAKKGIRGGCLSFAHQFSIPRRPALSTEQAPESGFLLLWLIHGERNGPLLKRRLCRMYVYVCACHLLEECYLRPPVCEARISAPSLSQGMLSSATVPREREQRVTGLWLRKKKGGQKMNTEKMRELLHPPKDWRFLRDVF